MVRVEITNTLFEHINQKFKQQSIEILEYLKSLEHSPFKGKELGHVGGILVKELRYSGWRFYFITDGFKIKYLEEGKLVDLLLRFVRMSDKKHQQETIAEIKHILRIIGPSGFV